MAVYRIKRIKRKDPSPPPADTGAVKASSAAGGETAAGAPAPQTASPERESSGGVISRSKNRSLDAYVGSGKSARRLKENGGSMVDAVYNRREKATDETNETDRMLLEAFSDEKTLKKERKRQEKERKREEKRRKKLEKKGLLSDKDDRFDLLVGKDDYSESLDRLEEEDDSDALPADPFEMLRSSELPSENTEDSDDTAAADSFEMISSSEPVPGPDGADDIPEADDAVESAMSPESVFAAPEAPPADPETADGEESGAGGADESAMSPESVFAAPDVPPPEPETADDADESALSPDSVFGLGAPGAAEAAAEIAPDTAPDDDAKTVPTAEELAAAFEERPGEPKPSSQAAPDMSATKVFRFTGMDADEIKKILEQEGLSSEKTGPDDSGKPAADIYDDSADGDSAEELLRAAKRKKQPEEYTDPSLTEEMTEGIKNASVKSLALAIWSFLVMAVALYLDSACFSAIPHPAFLTPGKYGAVLILFDLQMILISGMLVGSDFIGGLKALFTGRADHNSVTAFALTVTGLYNVSLLITSSADKNIMLFSSAGCLFGFLNALCRFLESRQLYRAFRVVSSKKPKFVARRLGTDSGEFEALKEHLPEDPDIFTVEKTAFVTGFMANCRKPSKASGAYAAGIWIVLVLAAAFGIYNLSGGAANAFRSFTLICLFGLPACGIFALSVPLGKMSRRCASGESAMIGAAAADEYSGASVISFNDTELFPADKIRVTSIRTYGNIPIERSILYSAMIFKKVGGPLSEVFAKSISSVYPEIPSDFDVLENTGDGICAKIDGREIFVGNKDYILSYDFKYVNEDIDEAFENSVGRIMYMAEGDSVAAKFYIRYAFNARFERVMLALHRAGTCVCVKTCDPNIDDDLIRCMLRKRNYPVAILKTAGASCEKDVGDKAESSLVCSSSILNMLRAFIFCAKAKKLISINILVKFISLFVGVFAAAVLVLFGRMNGITPLFVMIYQLLWVLAVIIPSMSE